MTDPFVRWRGTALWRALDVALSHAQAGDILQLGAAGGRGAAIGHLCMWLDAEGLVTGTRLAAVRVILQLAGWREEEYANNLAFELCALFDNRTSVMAVAEYLERFEDEVNSRRASTLSERLALAEGAHRAYESAGESDANPA